MSITCVCVAHLSLRVLQLLHLFFDFHFKHLFHLHLHLLHLIHMLPSFFLHLGQGTPAHSLHQNYITSQAPFYRSNTVGEGGIGAGGSIKGDREVNRDQPVGSKMKGAGEAELLG